MKMKYEKPEIYACLIKERESIITTSNEYELPIMPAEEETV